MIQAPYKRYNGGKSGNGTFQTIINHIPHCTVYMEPFVGNGGIVRRINLPGRVIIRDMNQKVVEQWRTVLDELPLKQRNKIYLSSGDGLQLIEDHLSLDRSAFMFCDPPYVLSTRKSNKQLYLHDWDDEFHHRFLSLAVLANCNVMISHPACELYEQYLRNWYTVDFQSMTRSGLMWDRIWMNYPKPSILQDYRYLGENYREREVIRRKVNRFDKKIKSLPEVQRIAVLSSIIANNTDAAAAMVKQVTA